MSEIYEFLTFFWILLQGATIQSSEPDSNTVKVARVMRGGAADRSGKLSVANGLKIFFITLIFKHCFLLYVCEVSDISSEEVKMKIELLQVVL